MSLFTVSTPFNISLEFALAPFYKRALAWMADLIILFLYSYIMIFFVYDMLYDGRRLSWRNAVGMEFALALFTLVFPVMFYHLLFEVLMNGRSPGKWLMGIKVINREGASATLSQLLLRWMLFLPNYFLVIVVGAEAPVYFLGIAFILALVALPDIISILVSTDSQRLGDLAAGTVVVDVHHKMNIADTIYMDITETSYIPSYPEVLQLSDRDIHVIRNLIGRKRNKDVERHIYQVAYKIEEVLAVKMAGAPDAFLQQLLKDYNYLTQQKK